MILLSPGIAQGCFELLETAARYPLAWSTITTSFPRFGSVESKVVLSTAQSMNWITADEMGAAFIAPMGARLLGIEGYRMRLRQSLLDYVELAGPPWVEQASFGRRKVINFAPPTIQQMLYEAGLSDGSGDDVVEFWDALAARARGQRDDHLTSIGRRGERLTLAYEEKRTGRRPKWIAIDSNDKGYDVLSVVSSDNFGPYSIEVKTSSIGLKGSIHITRNEWERACEAEKHSFHLWDVSASDKASLAIISLEQMVSHVPNNSGQGSWESVEIPIMAFENNFQQHAGVPGSLLS